jgi:predicted RNA-binding Zn-ribbon protein involved in translation (DUF1610 family)
MRYKAICTEINGVFYESLKLAEKTTGCNTGIIKTRCLSDEWSNYKIVPFRITYTEKECPKCGEVKLLKEFNTQKSAKDGLRWDCKKCQSKYRKQYYQDNKEEERESTKQWRSDNSKHVKEWKKENAKQINKTAKKWRENNPEKVKQADKTYRKGHREQMNERQRKKRHNNYALRLNTNVGNSIRESLRGMKKGRHWEGLVGYHLEELVVHLESKFTEGMSWDNYGYGKYKWNLDHVIAVAKFNITSAECQDFKDCWALINLQPLWHVRNMEKSDKPMEPKYLIKPDYINVL